MDKIQNLADRLFKSTPELARRICLQFIYFTIKNFIYIELPNDSILKQNSKIVAYTNGTKLPNLGKNDSNSDLKKGGKRNSKYQY